MTAARILKIVGHIAAGLALVAFWATLLLAVGH
jgi:hypothetical protein